MALVESPLHSSLVEDLQMALTATLSNDDANNGFNENESSFNAIQKGAGPKIIINATENVLIKIIPYEAKVTKVCAHNYMLIGLSFRIFE